MPNRNENLLMVDSKKAISGDVLSIPSVSGLQFFSLVLIARKLLYLAVFKGLYAPTTSFHDVVQHEPALAAWTADAEIQFGRWKIVGRKETKELGLSQPSYLVGFEGEQWVEDVDGNLVRKASEYEAATLTPRRSFSPAAFEHVVLAMNGHGAWRANWDSLLIGGVRAV